VAVRRSVGGCLGCHRIGRLHGLDGRPARFSHRVIRHKSSHAFLRRLYHFAGRPSNSTLLPSGNSAFTGTGATTRYTPGDWSVTLTGYGQTTSSPTP